MIFLSFTDFNNEKRLFSPFMVVVLLQRTTWSKTILRSSHRRCSARKRCSSKFRKIHEKTPVSCRFVIKLQALDLYFYTKENPTQVFSCEFWEIFKNTF